MRVKKLVLEHVGRFKESLELLIAPTANAQSNVTILVGVNGSGKSTVIENLALCLSWLAARIKSEKGSGRPILEEKIANSSAWAEITVSVEHENVDYEWTISKTREGLKSNSASQLSSLTRLADLYREGLTIDESASLPMMVYYPTERVVLDIPLKIKNRNSFKQLDGYDNSLSQGVDFRRFFEWFREREDSENEESISEEQLKVFEKNKEIWAKIKEFNASARDRQLTAVRNAIASFLPDFKGLRVRRKPTLRMEIEKKGEILNVTQLSQGEKNMIALVGDIARRLAMMNPVLENPLKGNGLVLIDEVDMHLHPRWQRNIVERLSQTFPNCQFILTTHSPLVISDSKNILCYLLNEDRFVPVQGLYGMDVNQVLEQIMDTGIRNAAIDQKLSALLKMIEKGDILGAQEALSRIKEELPADHIEVMKSELLLRRMSLLHEKNK